MKTLLALGIIVCLVWLMAGSVAEALVPPEAAPRSGFAEGLDGYWTFDETNGAILHDYSGHGYNGTAVNFPFGQGNWTSGHTGGALEFGGPTTHEYVHVPTFGMPTDSMTLTAWVWANTTPRWATIAANWNGVWGAFNYATFGGTPNMSLYAADGNVQGGFNIDYGVSTVSLPMNQWHFVAFVADSQTHTVVFMQDGAIAGSFQYLGQMLASSSQLNIGDDPSDTNAGQGNWDGKLDDLAIWTRPLTFPELGTIYRAGLTGQSLMTLMTPTISCPEAQTLECGGPATVTVQVGEPDGAALMVFWALNGMLVQTNTIPAGTPPTASNVSFTADLPPGANLVEVEAVNSLTNTAYCSTTIVVGNKTPPVISGASASPNILWPPNHKLVPVTVDAVASDNCGLASWKIIQVESNERINGTGSGKTASDWQILGDHMVALRAERAGNGFGRIYTITLQAEDAAGNLSSPSMVTVTVPKN